MSQPKGLIPIVLVIFITAIAASVVGAAWWYQERVDELDQVKQDTISTFEECIAAGNPAMESYPRKCAANGNLFIEIISNSNINSPVIDPLEDDIISYGPGADVDDARKDCDTRGGVFDSCGSACDDPRELCIAVCVPKCDLTNVDETADWQTYTNEERKYTFKYPSQDWDIELDGINDVVQYTPGWCNPECHSGLTIKVRNISVQDFIDEYNAMDEFSHIVSQEQIMLGNDQATKLTASTAIGVDAFYIFADKFNTTYILEYNDDEVIDQIVDTFGFIDIELSTSDQFQEAVSKGNFDNINSLLAEDIQYTLMSSGCCAGYTTDQVIVDLSMRVDGSSSYNFDQTQTVVGEIKASHTQYEDSIVGISDEDEVLIYKAVSDKIIYIQYGATTKLYVGG